MGSVEGIAGVDVDVADVHEELVDELVDLFFHHRSELSSEAFSQDLLGVKEERRGEERRGEERGDQEIQKKYLVQLEGEGANVGGGVEDEVAVRLLALAQRLLQAEHQRLVVAVGLVQNINRRNSFISTLLKIIEKIIQKTPYKIL